MKYLGAKSNDGYHNQKTGFCSYFLTFEDGARIEIMNIPEMADLPKKLARTGYSHIAFSVGSIEKVDELTAELKADGYEVISGPRTTGDGYYESCIVAVEDNQIEITDIVGKCRYLKGQKHGFKQRIFTIYIRAVI